MRPVKAARDQRQQRYVLRSQSERPRYLNRELRRPPRLCSVSASLESSCTPWGTDLSIIQRRSPAAAFLEGMPFLPGQDVEAHPPGHDCLPAHLRPEQQAFEFSPQERQSQFLVAVLAAFLLACRHQSRWKMAQPYRGFPAIHVLTARPARPVRLDLALIHEVIVRFWDSREGHRSVLALIGRQAGGGSSPKGGLDSRRCPT